MQREPGELPGSRSVELGMQERRAGHRDEVRERIGPRYHVVGEQADRSGLTLRFFPREEVIDDVAELVAAAKPCRRRPRKQHSAPRGLTEPAVTRQGDRMSGKPRALAVERRAAFETERDLSAASLESVASPKMALLAAVSGGYNSE